MNDPRPRPLAAPRPALVSTGLCFALLAVLAGGTLRAADSRPRSSWLSSAGAELRAGEYRFSRGAGDTWTAPNRAQDLRSFVSAADGWVIEPRTEQPPSWRIQLRLTGIGRARALVAPGTPALRAEGPRVELGRDLVIEWFENDRRGVKQGFTVPTAVGAASAGDPLVLDLAVRGAATEISADAQQVSFRALAGDIVVFYDDLVVHDATGQAVPSWFAAAPEGLRIVIDDRGAVYPLEVDPLATSADWAAESNQEGAEFGTAVASAGDVNNDGFDDVIVGADEYDNAESSEGAAFVYYGSPAGPSVTPSWSAESDQIGADFGISVAAAGDVNGDGFGDVIIGAHRYDNGDSNEGAAFVFYGSANGLALPGNTRPIGKPINANWSVESNQLNGDLGISVASAGDVNNDSRDDIIVGADEYDNGHTNEGAAFVFHGSTNGLALPGGTRPFGSPSNANWTAQAGATTSDFGFTVAAAGNVDGDLFDDVIVGAHGFNDTFEDEGLARLYRGSASGLQPAHAWSYEGGQDFALFGISVDSAGDVDNDGFDDVLIGAEAFNGAEDEEGAAFLFFGASTGLNTLPGWATVSGQGASSYGASVAGAGDVNGDGFDDVLVGAPRFDDGELDEGAMFVYLGTPSGPSQVPSYLVQGDQAEARYGDSVNSAGDVNNDGLADVVVGAPLFDKPSIDEGYAELFFGCSDVDRDGLCLPDDNCPGVANPDQQDADGDGLGNLCDPCDDLDGDAVCDAEIVLIEGAGAGEQVLVQAGTQMRYLKNTSNPGLGLLWTDDGFNHASWPTGTFGVGYESDSGAEDLLATNVTVGSFSVYTRTTFTITDLGSVQNIFLGADYDDGYVAWINGIEVFRSPEIPAGTPVWNTNATSHESSNALEPNYGALHNITFVGSSALQVGVNVLAIGVYNSGGTVGGLSESTDLVLVPRLSINRPQTTTISYKANATDPVLGLSWVQPTFEDPTWQRGNYGVGYEAASGADGLIHSQVPNGVFSVYTRAKFNVLASAVNDVRLGADWDDGYVAWINGFEVFRSPQMPPSPVTPLWNTSAAAHESSNGAVPNYGVLNDISAATLPHLVNGENVLAIGVWNNAAPSDTDLVLVPRLSINGALVDNCPTVPNANQLDTDLDGDGNACDPDDDNDTVLDGSDNCPLVANLSQTNADGDALGDACDACPNDAANDIDGDTVCGNLDNCPTVANASQSNVDGDGPGDACDSCTDTDGDGFGNPGFPANTCPSDNCPTVVNVSQVNADGDPNGDACDCVVGNNQVWGQPSAITTLLLSRVPATTTTTLNWTPPALGATSAVYDTLRSGNVTTFGASALCLDTNGTDTTTTDTQVPVAGSAFAYLVRVENGCPTNNSNMGTGVGGAPRTGRTCP